MECRKMQYLFEDGENVCFVDNKTFEMKNVLSEKIRWEKNFLVDDLVVDAEVVNGEIQKIILPETIALRVVECRSAAFYKNSSAVEKTAVVESGLAVRVPLFVLQDEMILVSTSDGTYVGRKSF